jgi:DNA-binding HxlR family transcriptional regulator
MENSTNNDLEPVINQENPVQEENNCPMTNALKIIGGKWKLLLLNSVRNECTVRFGQLKKTMPDITQTTLTTQLRELERDGIIRRKVYAEAPPKVEYTLTDLGKTLIPVIEVLCSWGDDYCRITKAQH